jgi:hypothetical protein
MCVIQLSKEDTLKLSFVNLRRNNISNRYNFETKYLWKCLGCTEIIYVSYKEFSNTVIFCNRCKHKAKNPSREVKIVQYHYSRILKEQQLKQIEAYFDKIII